MTPSLAFELEVYEADLGRMEFEPYRRAIRMSIPLEIPSPIEGRAKLGPSQMCSLIHPVCSAWRRSWKTQCRHEELARSQSFGSQRHCRYGLGIAIEDEVFRPKIRDRFQEEIVRAGSVAHSRGRQVHPTASSDLMNRNS